MNPGEDTLRLLLVRHGATAWNTESRIIGRTDFPLSDHGKRQARQLADRLTHEGIAAIYTSNMKRAIETAAAIADSCRLSPRVDDRLREMDFGRWEGLTLDDVQNRFSESFMAWKSGNPLVGPPDGESPESLARRVQSFVDDLVARHMGQSVLVVSHGGVFQAMVFLIMNIPFRNGWHFYMYNGSISELWLTAKKAVMVSLNDTHHLHSD
jgi:broad specificity phosphatase PhoE